MSTCASVSMSLLDIIWWHVHAHVCVRVCVCAREGMRSLLSQAVWHQGRSSLLQLTQGHLRSPSYAHAGKRQSLLKQADASVVHVQLG